MFLLSFDAAEQQRGQPTLLPVCEVPGHTGPEVSTRRSQSSPGVILSAEILSDKVGNAVLNLFYPGVLQPRITSRTCLDTGAGQCSGCKKRQASRECSDEHQRYVLRIIRLFLLYQTCDFVSHSPK